MKYKLKRDLPLAKAGTKVRKAGGVKCIPITVWPHGAVVSDEYFDQLISEGWIEPIKPREWTLEVTPEQTYIRILPIRQKLFSSGSEIIKVREVIE